MTDESQTPIKTYAYDAFGRIRSETGELVMNRWTYTGREAMGDSAGLYYYRWRVMDPNTGRFTSEDPLGFVDGPNRYGYVGNDSINYGDPMGMFPYDGNYGGANWTAGRHCSWEGTTPTDRDGNPPKDDDDKCYMKHDECRAECRSKHSSACRGKAYMRCKNACDRDLRNCLRKVPHKKIRNYTARGAFVCLEGSRNARITPLPGVIFLWPW